MARRPSPSPVAVAIERLGKLAAAGTTPGRMDRAARQVLAEWRAVQEPDIARRWASELHADVLTGLIAAEEQADDADATEPGAVKHMTAVVEALRATRDALAAEMLGS